jgi:hypothetical protein
MYTSIDLYIYVYVYIYMCEDQCQHVLAHCASASAAAGVIKAKYNLLLLEGPEDFHEGMVVQHVTKQPVATERCLPCFPQRSPVGMLSQSSLEDFVAHVIRPSVFGPILRVECFRVSHTKVDGDKFCIGALVPGQIAGGLAAEAPVMDDDSDLDWASECQQEQKADPRASQPDPDICDILGVDPAMVMELQAMLEDEADIVDDGDDREEVPAEVVDHGGQPEAPEAQPVLEAPPGVPEAPPVAAEPRPAIVLSDCFNSLWHIKSAGEAASLCGCRLHFGSIRREADDKEVGRMQVTFEGRSLQTQCRQHAGCKLLANVGHQLHAVESACTKWLLAGLALSAADHQRYGQMVKQAIKDGRLAV